MSKINYKETLVLKYASSLFEYINLTYPDLELTKFSMCIDKKIAELDQICFFENLRFLQYVLLTNKKILSIIENIEYSSSRKFSLLNSLLPDLHPVLVAFLTVLEERNHMHYLLLILDSFAYMLNESLGIKSIKIISKIPLSNEFKMLIKNFLLSENRNKRAIFDFFISERILSGIIIIDGFKIWDLSFYRKLKNLIKLL